MNLSYLQKPKALLVDMDGTLIDTIPMLYEAYMSFLKSYGILGTSKEFEELLGPSLSEIIVFLKQRYKLTDDQTVLLDTYQLGLQEAYEQDVKFFPFALETMHYAKKQNIKLALVSASEKHFVKAFVKGAGLVPLFDHLVAFEQGTPSKPHPALYLKALELLKFDPSEAVAIEDSINGVQSATGAGVYTFWIKHHTFFASNSASHPYPELNQSQDLYRQIDDWKNMMEWLKGVSGE